MKIAFHAPQNEFADALLEQLQKKLTGDELVVWRPDEKAPATDFEALIAFGAVTRELMAGQPRLALVQTASDGYEAVDVEAASALGIWVSYTPGKESGNAGAVAEYAVMLLIAAYRRLSQALLFAADRSQPRPLLNTAVNGSTVCIVGFGEIGSRIAELLRPFGARLMAVDHHTGRIPKEIRAWGADQLKEALAETDACVLCVRAAADNEHLINAEVLGAAKRGMVLVNVARGSLVDEAALAAAMKSGAVGAVGLDVVQNDPVRPGDPLRAFPQALVSPHIAGFTGRMLQGTAEYVAEALGRFRAGERFSSLLNEPKEPRRTLQGQQAKP